MNLFDVSGRVLLELDEREVERVAKQAGVGLEKRGAQVSERFARNVERGTTIAGAAVGVFVAGAGQDFVRFDDQMRQVFSILPDISGEAMDEMRGQVMDLSTDIGVLPEEVIPALYTALSSGIPRENVFTFLEVATKAAKAGATDAETSVKVLSATLNAFGIDAANTEQVADSLFTAVNLGVIRFDELATSLSQVSPLAASMGVSLDELLASMVAMTLQGTPTGEAVTAIRSSLVALQRTTPEMEAALKSLGFETGQAALDALGYQGVMEALRKEGDRTGVEMIKLTGRVEGTQAVLQLTGENGERAREILEKFGYTTGEVDRAFEVMNTGVGGAARKIAAAVKVMSIQVGEHIGGLTPIFAAFGPTMARLMGAGLGALGGKIIAPAITAALTSAPVTAAAGAAGAGVGTVVGTALGLTERFTNATVEALVALPGASKVTTAARAAGAAIGVSVGLGIAGGILLILNEKYAEIFGGKSAPTQILELLATDSGTQAGTAAGTSFIDAMGKSVEGGLPDMVELAKSIPGTLSLTAEEAWASVPSIFRHLPAAIVAAKKETVLETETIPGAIASALAAAPFDLTDWHLKLREIGKLPTGKELLADVVKAAADLPGEMARVFKANNPQAEAQLLDNVQSLVGIMTALEAAGIDVPTATVQNLAKTLRQIRNGEPAGATRDGITAILDILATLTPAAGKVGKDATASLGGGMAAAAKGGGGGFRPGVPDGGAVPTSAASAIVKSVTTELEKTVAGARAAGADTGYGLGGGISSTTWYAVERARLLRQMVINAFRYGAAGGGGSSGGGGGGFNPGEPDGGTTSAPLETFLAPIREALETPFRAFALTPAFAPAGYADIGALAPVAGLGVGGNRLDVYLHDDSGRVEHAPSLATELEQLMRQIEHESTLSRGG